MDIKRFTVPLALKDTTDGVAEGSVSAAISVFNEVDTQGDVVLPSFFTDGQEVAMAAWGHNWSELPAGKGIVRVTPSAAVFDGAFFMDTTQGRDHYNTVKAMGALQEWSFGFGILDAEPGTLGGAPVRFLKRGEIFEGSPVLIGANRNTQTLAIKAALGSELPYAEHLELVTAQMEAFLARTADRAGYRAKEGRVLSAATITRLGEHPQTLRGIASGIEDLLAEAAPKPKGISPDEARALEVETYRTYARLRGYLQEAIP